TCIRATGRTPFLGRKRMQKYEHPPERPNNFQKKMHRKPKKMRLHPHQPRFWNTKVAENTTSDSKTHTFRRSPFPKISLTNNR
ncbi:MAG: hypothetical protein J6W50_00620, partial [Bacteroidaceae bacterium]|nr:hypothetical protein [Bacteroidaceae bacterium]